MNDEDDDSDVDVGLLHGHGDDHVYGGRRVQDSKAVTQPVSSLPSAGWRSPPRQLSVETILNR